MKIILAPDSFKGSLTAIEAAQAMKQGIHDYDPSIETVLLPAADGGEGTICSLVEATNGKIVTVIVQDALGRKTEASYGILGDGKTCVIEIAEASGLIALTKEERNPLKASSYGTGELIMHALDAGLHNFIIGLGGSATNDGGAGILQALGMKLLDINGDELAQGGGALSQLHKIDNTNFDRRISKSSFLIASDVDNPLIGPNGASFVFGPQKGASSEDVKLLDHNLMNYANVIEKLTAVSLHNRKGAGAAGGAGGAFQAFFPGEMKQGVDVVLEAISFDSHLQDADLILTGEGKTDAQTFSGKTPFGIARVGRESEIPVILISGMVAIDSQEKLKPFFHKIYGVVDKTVSAEDSIARAFHYLRVKTKEAITWHLQEETNTNIN